MSAELSDPDSQLIQDLHHETQETLKRPSYSIAQLKEYFDRIKLPEQSRIYNVKPLDSTQTRAYLTLIQRHHAVTVPFENLTLHYSWHRVIHIDAQHLFRKIVQQPGRGGYCMENNTLLHTVLISLGFDAYTAGARIYKGPGYGGFTHCINIVTIDDTRYLVDVGFGPNSPIAPTSFGSDAEAKVNIAPARVRIRHGTIDQALNKRGLFWILEHQINSDADWKPLYCFTDTEFLPEDVKVINMAPGLSPFSWFTQKIVVTRCSTDLEFPKGGKGPDVKTLVGGEITGDYIIDGDAFKWRKNGETLHQRTFKNDAERLETLKDIFGIEFGQIDIDAIKGRTSEIKN